MPNMWIRPPQLSDYYWKGNLIKLHWDQKWEKSSGLGMPVCASQGLFLSVFADDIQNGWKKTEFESHVEETDETG